LTVASSGTIRERTEVLHNEQNVVNTVLQFVSNAKNRIDACIDYTRPSLFLEIDQLKKAFLDAKNRGVRLRYVTEVTVDNAGYCKELTKMVDELRHIEGIRGNFYVSETEYIAPAALHEKTKPAFKIIYSNVKEIVEHQQQYVFDSFWSRAIPAKRRINEIEQGEETLETKVLEDKEKIFKHMKAVLGKVCERSVCSSIGGMQLIYNNFFGEYKKILEKQRMHGQGRGVRWITSITDKDSVNLVKTFLNEGIQVKHVKNLTPMNFAVDSKHFYATIDKMEEGKTMQSLLVSNEPAYISHYNSIFEELWKNGVDATDRIKDIEAGVDLPDIEVIPSSVRAQEMFLNIIKTAKEEILWIFPTTNAFLRQDKMDAIPLATQAARERNVKVRILVPSNRLIEQKIQQLKEYCCCNDSPNNNHNTIIDVRYIEQMSETKATILVVDRENSLVMELRDDSKTTFIEAIGLSTYSNSKAGVLSYVAIFENLWKQSELYQQLKIHDKMQREFINIAAHELRTPIQPIIGLTQVVCSRIEDREQAKLLQVVNRNAKRLQRLTEDILDVTKIESQSLSLNKEKFNLKDVITNAIDDIMAKNLSLFSSSSSSSSSKIKVNNTTRLLYHHPQDVFVYADKGRISQVISNLLDNAVKFTKDGGGTIIFTVEEKKEELGIEQHQHNNHHQQEILVSIRDTGIGIDPQILPSLFSKFTTKSHTGGTGLGLFVCKGIIEAHGGRIWADDNNDKEGERGSTFYFSLPLTNI
jgi:two-component system, OmpR family, sensor histidine kinase VicK